MEAAISQRKNAVLSVLGGIGLFLGYSVAVVVWSQFQDPSATTDSFIKIGVLVLLAAIGLIMRGTLTAVTGRGWRDTPAFVRLLYIVVFLPVLLIGAGLAFLFVSRAVGG